MRIDADGMPSAQGCVAGQQPRNTDEEGRMPIVTTAVQHFVVVVLIGTVVGLALNRYGRNWLRRQTSGATGMGDVTFALVGIAGSFIGFHLAVILGLLPTPLMLYLCAAVGAVATLWLWRGR
jgi:hypothetical protein